MSDKAQIRELLAAHGGPFYALQRRLGMLQDSALKAERRALIFVALAWGVPFLLSLAEVNLLYAAGKPFLLDLGVWARFFIAVGAFILAAALLPLAAAGMTKLPYKELFAIVKKK